MSAEEARERGLGCVRGVANAACGYALGTLVALAVTWMLWGAP